MDPNASVSGVSARYRAILRLAWPLIISYGFANIQLTIDRVFLGHYSTEALAAAMAVMGIFWPPMALLQETSAYLMTFVAQYYGAKEYPMIGRATWQAIYVAIAGGLLFLLLIPATDIIFRIVGHSPAVQQLEREFFAALCFSALPTAVMVAVSGFFTGLGQPRTILWINLTGMLTNILGDYVLIFGHWGFPALGAAGAGYATSIANALAAALGLLLVLGKKYQATYATRSGWRPDFALIRRYLRFGVPSGLQWSLEGLAISAFLLLVGRMPSGDAALAASGIAVTVMMLAVLPAMALAEAAAILVAQLLGARKGRQAATFTWHGMHLALGYVLVAGLSFVAFPDFYLWWFANDHQGTLWADVAHITPYLLMFVAVFTACDAISLVCAFTLKGAGDTRFVSAVAFFLPWPLMVLPTWLMSGTPGGLYWAWGAALVYAGAQASVLLRRFIRGKWQSMMVIH